MIEYLAKGIRKVGLISLFSCITVATRSYLSENISENAYHNMQDILGQVCDNFQINPDEFHCEQRTSESGRGISHFKLDEIARVECRGQFVRITGAYDSSIILTMGPIWQDVHQQCTDLAEAMKIYLKERKK